MNAPARWFRRVVLLGVLANLFFALPGVFRPNAVIGLAGGAPAVYPIWPAFASLLLVLLSLFYIPAAMDPFRHRAAAWLTVVSRAAGVWFFLIYQRQYAMFGYLDLTFGVLQAILLVAAFRRDRTEEL
jgi:hypothetical protein